MHCIFASYEYDTTKNTISVEYMDRLEIMKCEMCVTFVEWMGLKNKSVLCYSFET